VVAVLLGVSVSLVGLASDPRRITGDRARPRGLTRFKRAARGTEAIPVSSSRDTYFDRIDETLVWRRAGGSATRRAGERGFARFGRSLIERALWKRPDGRSWRRGARGGRSSG